MAKPEEARQMFEAQEAAARQARQKAGRSLRTHTQEDDQRQKPTDIGGVRGRRTAVIETERGEVAIVGKGILVLADDGETVVPGMSQLRTVGIGVFSALREDLTSEAKAAIGTSVRNKKRLLKKRK